MKAGRFTVCPGLVIKAEMNREMHALTEYGNQGTTALKDKVWVYARSLEKLANYQESLSG